MNELNLASVRRGPSRTVAAAVARERVHLLPGEPTMRDVLDDWDAWMRRVEDGLDSGGLGPGIPLDEVSLAAPVPEPRNLYMLGANYADHAREMRGLPPDAPIEPSPIGPFVFLKPTTTVVGPGEPVRLPADARRLDWEVELAAVIGRTADRVDEADALSCVAGYTVINDVSARDLFKREPAAEPPMTFDWFRQKGWRTSCPMGPFLVPARFCPDPGALAISLRLNGELQQSSSTAQMIFSLQRQIAFISRVVPLLPGDVISTGTPAGVGAGRGRFLAAGDVMIAEIEGIGRLESPVLAEGGD
jgi:2-keto-4-pentenoate hydratase/2-oxohepta-3-ene-1,7-dioic acid hydratase in catechol pathway